METLKKIRIEKVGDINYDYPYLEVFYLGASQPFLDIGINDEKKLDFKFYKYPIEITLTVTDMDYILSTAKEFLPQAISDEEAFLNRNSEQPNVKSS